MGDESPDVKPHRKDAKAAEEQKSLTAKEAEDAEERKSFTAKDLEIRATANPEAREEPR